MLSWIKNIQHRLVTKLILTVGLTLLVSISAWSYSIIRYQEDQTMHNLSLEADRLSTTIKLGTHYAMMLNSREDIAETIKNISRQPEIRAIRIYNKSGQITYSDDTGEIGRTTNIKDEACYVCHRTDPPLVNLDLSERTRIFRGESDVRLLGILSAIYNEPGCASAGCHVHPEGKKVLGALDVVLTLAPADKEITAYKRWTTVVTVLVLLLTAVAVLLFIMHFVNRPVSNMIAATRRIARGENDVGVEIRQEDEMGQLADAITYMGGEIKRKQAALNKQRKEYQRLFELVPCIITVQDRNYRLINYNREFAEKFAPTPMDTCYHAYKGRTTKCEPCPVEKAFEDGEIHRSEESGVNWDGTMSHWIVIASPVWDEKGEIQSAMEISLDITDRRLLEQELEKSEQKYHAIFNNIPNAVFVLDPDTLDILDCNDSMTQVYGYEKGEILGRSFLELHEEAEREQFRNMLRSFNVVNQVKQRHKTGRRIFVNIRVSPSEYTGQRVLLVTTSDITKRLDTEEQLAQASKLATLGEMATGVAHELNQPLSVIKTVSSFFMKKLNAEQDIPAETLYQMLGKVDTNVDRATKIITHMRLFARKSEVQLVRLHVEDVLNRAFEIFTQQLRARGIEVVREFSETIPPIMADPDRLEQVFINLLINARDAIEERWDGKGCEPGDKRITVRTKAEDGAVIVEVQDTGSGIDDAHRDKIFDPFFTTKEVGKGTGLGLSISYGIVKDCGGDICVAQTEGPGACFTVRFPIKDEDDESTNHTPGG
ncbi:MAG: PAS domain S-box protein [Deltaproteobacteria bacterium]|nr:PAS domain S-box protein [Deltaproteobacteria bacterium]